MSAKPNPKRQVETALEELEKLYKSRDRAGNKLEKELPPFGAKLAKAQEVYESSTEDIQEKFAVKREKPEERIAALEKEIEGVLLSNLDSNGEPKLKLVVGEKLASEAGVTRKTRDIDPKAFMDKFKTGWSCLMVLIGKADKAFGASEVSKIAKENKFWGVEIKEV